MTNDFELIIDKIRKLIALSKSPNEHEAASAAAKAQALLLEHNIAAATLTEGKSPPGFATDDQYVTWGENWKGYVCSAIALLYLCRYIGTPYVVPNSARQIHQHSFVGLPHNAIVAREIARYVVEAIERVAALHCETIAKHALEAYSESFKLAAAGRIGARVRALINEAKAGAIKRADGSNLPVPADIYDRAFQEITAEAYPVASCAINIL